METAKCVRVVMSLVLLYGAYHETGIFTAISIGLGMSSVEILNMHFRSIN